MSFIKEFREFAMRGNVMDMAVGIIIGVAFGKIVSSLVNDIIMPPIGFILGGVDFTDLKASMIVGGSEEPVTINYGTFVQTTIDFLLIAFAIFLMIKAINSLKKKEEAAPAAPPEPSAEEKLLTEIRDLLKK